uniref:Uncharacterized protein n=1 Tax=Steinernema glaseri TaxID=37863 RepID=A0A1I8A7I0_9BILA
MPALTENLSATDLGGAAANLSDADSVKCSGIGQEVRRAYFFICSSDEEDDSDSDEWSDQEDATRKNQSATHRPLSNSDRGTPHQLPHLKQANKSYSESCLCSSTKPHCHCFLCKPFLWHI